jgi:uncharacterized membrane protein
MTNKLWGIRNINLSKARLEFLFDGIFAIAMTILVLELKVPEIAERRNVSELADGLLQNGRLFFSFFLSFMALGSFWLLHNHIYHYLEKISRLVLVIHIYLMMVAAFFPFCARLLGLYPGNSLALSIWFGAIWLFLLGILVLCYAADKQNLFSLEFDRLQIKRIRNRMLKIAIVFFFFLATRFTFPNIFH